MLIKLTGCTVRFAVDSFDSDEMPETNEEQQNEETDISSTHNIDELPFDGKIVIVTNTDAARFKDWFYSRDDAFEDELVSAEALVDKYGPGRVIHKTWPDWWDPDGEEIIDGIFREISEDPEVRAAVLIHSIPHLKYWHIENLLQDIRDDIFVVYIPRILTEREVINDVKANLIIQTDMRRLGEAYVEQAISMGAETIAYYSNPRNRSIPAIVLSRDAMMATAEREGIKFIDFEAPSWANVEYLTQEITRQVDSLGINTAIFVSWFEYQSTAISLTSATGAIFVQTDEILSPFMGYPVAFEIEHRFETDQEDELGRPIVRRIELPELMQALDEAVDAAGMSGRISSWAVPDRSMWITVGFMYAVEWLSGNVPQEHGVIDLDVLEQLAREYSAQFGLDTGASFEAFTDDEGTIGHYVLSIIDYYIFGK